MRLQKRLKILEFLIDLLELFQEQNMKINFFDMLEFEIDWKAVATISISVAIVIDTPCMKN